jgi:hypothetical protein
MHRCTHQLRNHSSNSSKKKRGQQSLWYKLQNIIYVQSQAIPMEGYHFVSNGDGDLLGGKHTIQNK